MRKIGVSAAQSSLGKQHRQQRRARSLAMRGRLDHHRGEARGQRQRAHRLALWRQPAVGVERTEIAVERCGLGPGGARRRIEKGERGGVANAPMREIEREAREIGGENFGAAKGGSAPVAASSQRR